ncbi:MAG: S41 family peptidase [Anaerolineae bacterium]|nr:S41 family peptidase [Anaerolineae bacterium]
MISRKFLSASLTLALVFMVAVSGVAFFTAPVGTVDAQSAQPEDTVELFQPFWQAWDLLHVNYVDPLDDPVLAEGALVGLLKAVDQPLFDFPVPEIDPTAEDTDTLFAPFWETWALLHETFPDSLDDDELMQTALSDMIETIGDPHTDYFDPDAFELINEGVSGEYEGIGAVVQQDETTGGLELISIFEGSPAEAAGLRPGDQIVSVEGEAVTTLSQSEIIALVRGPAGTVVRLGVMRPGEAETLTFDVVRDRINTPSVTSELLEDNIGYVRLSRFDANTNSEMRAHLEALDANNLTGLVLDMRGNPGGYKFTSIEVASAFIPSGTIMIERGPGFETPSLALGNAIAPDVPMVILVDQGSASASELVSGAFQDNERAIIVGMPTFGKGSVQIWPTLVNGGGLRITISRWFTPNGNSVEPGGIIPDVEVDYSPEEISGDPDNQLTAAVQILLGTYESAEAELVGTDSQ